MSDIKFNEFKKVILDTFNAEVTDPTRRVGFNIINGETNIDDKLWGVRENVNSRPVSQLWLGGKKYGEVNPKEEHKLPYFYPKDNTNHQYKYTPDFLMLEDIYVVDTLEDFEKCKGIEVSSPDIKNEWVQFSDSNFSPEYYKGTSHYNDKHKPASITYGYGFWVENNRNIKNESNSCDYTGFINPQKSNKFNYTSIIGTDKGDISGGFGGVTLINDNYATPRHIIDTDGNIYYRNSLYDLTDDNGEKLVGVTDWCAWVNDLNNGSANVVYSSMVYTRTTYGNYEDDFPGNVGDLIDSYKIKDISTKNSRVNNREKNTQQITIQKCVEANGYIVVLNINTTNQILGIEYSGLNTWPLGTIAVHANVLPCGYDKAININGEHTYGKVKVDSNNYNYSPRTLTTHFVVANTGITGYDYMLGNNLVEVVPELDFYPPNNTNGYAFIRSDMSFDNGVLNVKFSDLKGQSGVTISDTELNDLLSNENLNTNFPLNGSELIIDFNNGTCEMTGRTGTSYTDSININDITSINDYQYLLGKDEYGNNIIKNINVGDYFKRGENIKFMYHSCSFSNNYFKSNGFSYKERLILDTQNDKVWEYDSVKGEYKENVGEKPVDYFTGSHISYNDITSKLFYSNGTKITQISTNCECFNEDDFITESMISVTYEELKNLKDTSGLIPGMQYRLTDYECTVTNESNARAINTGHFDIILVADDETTLNENVRFIHHEGDTYFADSDLSAWEGKYSLTNDTNKFDWADPTNGKGVIYWLKDEHNNECPYDFKNIQFKRVAISKIEATGITSTMLYQLQTTFVYDNNGGICYGCYGQVNGVPENVSYDNIAINYTFDNSIEKYYYTFTWVDDSGDVQDVSIVGQRLTNSSGEYPGVFNNQIQPVSRQYIFNPVSQNEFGYSLNNIVFVSSYSFDGKFYGYYGNKFGVNCYENTFGNDCHSNTFGNNCLDNTFGNFCNNNTFGNSCWDNTFGNSCWNNTFGNYCDSNTFGNNCLDNTFGNFCNNNTFGNNCDSNTFENICSGNTFGNNCWNITFGNNCNSNTFTNDNINYFTLDDGVENCIISGITTGPNSPLKNYHFLSNVSSYTLPSGSPLNINYQLVVGRKSDGTIIMVNPMDYLITSINV